MVVRLGVPSLTLLNSQRYRILQGQALQLQYASDVVATVRAWARVRYDNGEDSLLFIPDAVLVSDRVPALCPPSDVARYDGWVTDAMVELPLGTDSVKRGQVYIRLFMDPFGPGLCSDYCYSTFGQVALGTYIPAGPAGGAGHLEIVTVKANGAPDASTTYSLALSNTIRQVYGFAWYYASSAAVASRSLAARLKQPYGALPTGYATGAVAEVWSGTDVTLTASEDGSVFVDPKRSGSNDAATLAIDDGAANPSPFPRLVGEDDNALLVFNVGNGEGDDFDAIYVLLEGWVMP